MLRIAVIGVGPRGLSALERIISHTLGYGPPVEVLLIEPGELGVGVHDPGQPEYLLLNTVAGQLTVFSDEWMTPGAPVTPGPGFLAWCHAEGIAAGPDDFLPRRLLGRYLRWAAGRLLDAASPRLRIRHLRCVATGVREDGAGATVTLADGTSQDVGLAIVTTGHGLNGSPAGAAADAPYPLPDAVRSIPAGVTVGLLGAGLCAVDVIAALTVGRGGTFTGGRYVASGREPRIVLAGRSGLLPCARPAMPAHRRAAPARFLTAAAIAELRCRTPDGRLDFRRDVEPLIRREARARLGPATPAEAAAVELAFGAGPRSWDSHDAFARDLLRRARADLAEADRGLGVSMVKEALEVLRDHRDGLRAALDGPGLTAASYRYFTTAFAPLVNRTVIGPPRHRMRELLALVDAGVLRLGPGPFPVLAGSGTGLHLSSTTLRRAHRIPLDVVVKARVPGPLDDPARHPITASLRDRSADLPFLSLDRDGFVSARRAVAVFGPPAEGASYYNHYVPSPGAWSRALTDLDRVIAPAVTTTTNANHLERTSEPC